MKGKAMSMQICDTAIQLFAARGYKDVSVSEICKAVQITKPTFYKYVKTKEDILFHYYAFDPESHNSTWAVVEDNDYWSCIIRGFRLCFDHYMSLGTDLLARAMMVQISSGSLSFQADPQWNQQMRTLIKQAMRARQIKARRDPYSLLEEMKSCAMGFVFYLCTEKTENIPDAIEHCMDHLASIARLKPSPAKE